jgi:hypothetical protein
LDEALARATAAGGYAAAQELASRLHLRLGQTLAAKDRVRAIEHFRQAALAKDPAIAREAARSLEQLGVH